MTPARSFAPAFIRRAFFIGALALGAIPARAQRTPLPPETLGDAGRIDQAKGREILEAFRTQGIAGEYYLEFQLRVLPRRGDERTIPGRMWGTRNAQGEITRLALGTGGAEQRLLLQNGPQPAAWNRPAGAAAGIEILGEAALFAPLAGTDLTPFDLLRPFLFWTDATYQGVARINGRPSYQFLLKPPAAFSAKYPALAGVRVSLDSQYQALVQTEYLGATGRVLKSLTLLDLKRLAGDQWIPKSFDLRNEETRDKTRLTVTAAALSQHFGATLFTPAGLTEAVAAPAGAISLDP